jgi:dipeptidyl aminopeptidase/acylaminoacyl peptidase
LARVGGCWSPSFSPDASQLAFVSDLSGLPQVWKIDSAGGFPTLVTSLDDQVQSVFWAPNGEWLSFSVAPGGGMNTQIHVVRPDGSGERRLTKGEQDNNFLGRWAIGSLIMLSSSRDDPARTDAYIADPGSGELHLLCRGRPMVTFTDLSRDGRYALVSRNHYRGDNDIVLIDTASTEETVLTPHTPPATFGPARFAGENVYLSSNADRDLAAFGRVRPGQPIEILAERADAEFEGFEIARDGSFAMLAWNCAGRSELERLDLRTLQRTPGPALPAEILMGWSLSKDGSSLATTLSGASAPRDIWISDLRSGQTRRVTQSPHPGVDLASLHRPELVRFPAHDGLELSGWLYRAGAVPGPLVICFHGGPEGQERPWFSASYQALAARGISVFAPNVRGSSGFGKRFVHLDDGPLRFDGVRDIESCVQCVVGSGAADPSRIGVMGGSYGGYMTMAALTEFPDLFAAGANLFGIVNFETFFAHTEPWMAAISKVEYGDPDTQADMLRKLSPIHKVDRLKAPLIVLHGANDTNVPVVEAEQVVAELRKRGVPVEYVLFPDEGHGFMKTANKIASTVAIVRWFERYLSPRA